jgi:PAS domain S-box-containing protein
MGEMLGIPEEMFIGRTDREIVDMLGLDTAEAVEFERTDRLVLDEDRAVQVNEQPFTMADGTVRYLDISKWPVTLNGVSGYILGVGIDVTERRRLEEQLRQAVKMEAIGRLAGGVAHDFNNLLTVINGYVELALGAGAMDNALRADLEQVQDAGQRAADLTRRLLAFSRQQVLEMGPLDVNAAIEGMTQMLQRIIGEDVRLHLHLDPAGAVVRADQGQLEQMILNLAVNARDAMPQGGTLLLSTQRLRLAVGAAATRLGLDPGDYVRVTVRDTGVGMDALVQGHIFEPFFTTKEVGEGTGLGLAMVYGVVQDFGGAIEVDSVPGAGATFEIYLPLLQVAQETGPGQPMERGASCGGEAVLLVEDQESVRWLAQRVLRDLGYEVTTAGDASEAIRLCEARETPFDLLLVDVIMPDMGGPELVRRLARRGSRPRVLYMSGYAGGDDAPLEGGALLSKPFAVDELSRAVREALDGPRPD